MTFLLSYRLDYEDITICIIFVFQFNPIVSFNHITADAKHTHYPNVRIGRGVSGEYRRGIVKRS